MNRFLYISAAACFGLAQAQTAFACSGEYVVRSGETLSTIAEQYYEDVSKWPLIYQANIRKIGSNPNAINVGKVLQMPCIDSVAQAAPAPAPVQAAEAAPIVTRENPIKPETDSVARLSATPLAPVSDARIRILTGDHLPPFAGRSLMGGGLMTEVVEAAMTAAVGSTRYETVWAATWNEQVDEVIASHQVEMSFPYAAPDCNAADTPDVCNTYYFSEPIFEFLELLYVDSERPIAFTQDSDLQGRRICRPQGLQSHFLDTNGRNLLKDKRIILSEPPIATDCFFLLLQGDVDGVILNEFTAREKLTLMGVADRVVAVSRRPVAISSQHMRISKNHPNAETLLATFNAGLATIRTDGRYREIVSRHLEFIWSQFQEG